jgi:hypothetical protein
MPTICAQLISTRPETLLTQMRGHATVAAAEAQGDDLIGEVVRAGWMRTWETVHLSLGADVDETASFFACACSATRLRPSGFPRVPGGEGVFWAGGASAHACRVEQGGHRGCDEPGEVVGLDSRAGALAV